MAPWIKMRTDLRRHPKVVRMASALGADRYRVIGGLLAVWAVFDEQTEDGYLDGFTPKAMDEEIGWSGFCEAMIGVSWLSFQEHAGLAMPEFEEHNGQSAKRRAADTKRKRQGRDSEEHPQPVRTVSAPTADKKTTRGREEEESSSLRSEEGRHSRAPTLQRPDDVSEQTWTDWQQLRKTKRAPVTQTVLNDARSEAGKAGMPLERFLCIWCARGSQGLQADWLRADERRTPASQSAADRRAGTIAGLTNPGAAHGRDHRTVDVDATVVG